MKFSKDELTADFYNTCELYEHLVTLYTKTKALCDEIFDSGIENIKLIDLRLSEIHSLYNTVNLYLSIKPEMQHYEFSSLLRFWKEVYFQTYLVACENDTNTSWMHSEVENYLEQHNIVERMLSDKIQELRETIC